MIKTLMLSFAFLSSAFAVSPASAPGHAVKSEDTYEKVANQYEQRAVNAKVDRVWGAIPGLCGWKLDADASRRATEQAHDHKLHLMWTSVPPDARLRDLPAHPIYRATDKEKSVCLMFNVSWGEAYVPSLLETLKQEGERATFFLDGAWVKKHPDLAKRIAQDGHVIGSHGTGHPNFQRLSAAALQQQVVGTNQVIRNIVGVEPHLLAPPAGAFDSRTVQTAAAANMYTILWTMDTIDWRKPPASTIVSRATAHVEPGALILMHPTEPTAQALPVLIRGLKSKGYRIKTVDQVVREEPVVVPPSTLSE